MAARIFGAVPSGMEGNVVEIQGVSQKGTGRIQITGLPGDVVRESKARICACLQSFGYDIPTSEIVLHLCPAPLKKKGSQLDLPLAIQLLCVENCLPISRLTFNAFVGELALDGRLLRVEGALGLFEALLERSEIQRIYVPEENAWEAGLIQSPKLVLCHSLTEVLECIHERVPPRPAPPTKVLSKKVRVSEGRPTLAQVRGQVFAKRALQVAIAGQHHILFVGAPGMGKSLLANCAKDLLPPLYLEELIELAKIYRSDLPDGWERPFRSPHHGISSAALLGGGSGDVQVGEISLAHRGVLFLDEFTEYRRDALEGLREPLQSGEIHIRRVSSRMTLPARFLLIAAMNPCPCGYHGSQDCNCSRDAVRFYQKKVSGPILDRIDIRVQMDARPKGRDAKAETVPVVTQEAFRKSIVETRKIQWERIHALKKRNINVLELPIEHDAFKLVSPLDTFFQDLSDISYRAVHKILRVSRTIADLGGSDDIQREHLTEALVMCRRPVLAVS